MAESAPANVAPSGIPDADPAPKLVQEETKKLTEDATKADDGAQPTSTVAAATETVKNEVFAMFGGGPKKEKKAEADDEADEPSGSSKAKKEAEVSYGFSRRTGGRAVCHKWRRKC